jgi:hypothetical protein
MCCVIRVVTPDVKHNVIFYSSLRWVQSPALLVSAYAPVCHVPWDRFFFICDFASIIRKIKSKLVSPFAICVL